MLFALSILSHVLNSCPSNAYSEYKIWAFLRTCDVILQNELGMALDHGSLASKPGKMLGAKEIKLVNDMR